MTFYWDRYFITTYLSLWVGSIALAIIGSMMWTSSTVVSLVEKVHSERVEKDEARSIFPDRKGAFVRQFAYDNPLLKLPDSQRQ